jgi:GMP synthase (glutamine-hydrolysing)
MATHQTVLILDFGSQFTQLIARRLREQRVYCEVHPFSMPAEEIRRRAPIGIVLSGGPQSVYDAAAPHAEKALLELGVPVLGICYGMQLVAHLLDGKVERAERREYGRAEVELQERGLLFSGLEAAETVWMSHGDHVTRLPSGFLADGSGPRTRRSSGWRTGRGGSTASSSTPRSRTPCTAPPCCTTSSTRPAAPPVTGRWPPISTRQRRPSASARRGEKVLCGISGGVDSAVTAALLKRAIGDDLVSVFVDTGLLRKGERAQVEASLTDGLGIPIVTADAGADFLGALAGVTDPEAKRKAIGRVFIDVFQREARKFSGVKFLAQGTLYPDVIESTSVRGPSAVIKSHHNVGGLPERLGFELVEPLRWLFKDEVRQLGRELGLPEEFIGRHPFPGPGLAVRILGEVTAEKVALLQEADAIFIGELRASGWYEKVSQAFAVLLPVKTVGVMGDFRTYENVLALRSVETHDFMTADWSHLPHELLGRVANRIVNEVRGINRVVYDVTSKPPGTIEWE